MIEDAFTHSDCAIHVQDPSGSISRVNTAFLQLYRFDSEAEVRGMGASVLHSTATPASVHAELADATKAGHPWRGNLINRAKDGTEVHVQFTCTPILREGGWVGMMGFSLDRSRLRALETQLFNASKLAIVGSFGTGLAHELTNPLASIMLDAEYLRDAHMAPHDGPMDHAGAFQAAESVIRGAEKIRRILNHLLLYSRQDADQAPSTISIGALLKDSLVFMEKQLQSQGISIRVEAAPGLTVVGNRTLLESVLHNLLGNSRDAFAAMDGAAKSIAIEAGWQEEERMVLIRYRDNAGGMPERIRERIFEPGSTERGIRGSGFGLAVIRQILARHGGGIECCPLPGGTEFRIRLPGEKTAETDDAGVIELPALV